MEACNEQLKETDGHMNAAGGTDGRPPCLTLLPRFALLFPSRYIIISVAESGMQEKGGASMYKTPGVS